MIGPEEQEAVARVLASGRLAAGPEVAAFESEFAAHTEVAEAVAVANGTVALWLALRAAGIGPGDEVIVPSFTFIATAGAVAETGARPVFADIDPGSFCTTAETVRPHIGARTAAVVAVHLYGHPAPLAGLCALCREHGLLLVEDAAQAHGARWEGRPVGGIGDVGTFSFYPTKNMTTGEGGMVTTDDAGLAGRVRSLRDHGRGRDGAFEICGTNGRMTEMAGAIGRVQLRRLAGWVEQRRSNAAWLSGKIGGSVTVPGAAPGVDHAWHQYTVRCRDRGPMTASLTAAGVGHGVYYASGCHLHPELGDPSADLAETERASAEVISLPVRPDLTDEELSAVAAAVIEGVE
jgi:dTDP-4-amino-4,6-dideoxygalactose transaminase